MSEARLTTLTIESPPPARTIAVRLREGKSPGLVWLGGFKSDMKGTKAVALDSWAATASPAATSRTVLSAAGWRRASPSTRNSQRVRKC